MPSRNAVATCCNTPAKLILGLTASGSVVCVLQFGLDLLANDISNEIQMHNSPAIRTVPYIILIGIILIILIVSPRINVIVLKTRQALGDIEVAQVLRHDGDEDAGVAQLTRRRTVNTEGDDGPIGEPRATQAARGTIPERDEWERVTGQGQDEGTTEPKEKAPGGGERRVEAQEVRRGPARARGSKYGLGSRFVLDVSWTRRPK